MTENSTHLLQVIVDRLGSRPELQDKVHSQTKTNSGILQLIMFPLPIPILTYIYMFAVKLHCQIQKYYGR